ncbi:MAG: hypothetical protein K1Y02_13050, partial [Candidatus Hydrogenedentes bacterium]|nr:hypothetical protein [Candidatus Hydrogenedentota bacterium]
GSLKPSVIQALEAQSIRVPDGAQVVVNSDDKRQSWLLQSEGWLASVRGLRVEAVGDGLQVYRKYDFTHMLGFSFFGFGLGGLLVFLGGLVAIDICPKNASGAAMGFVGLFSYLGASIQDFISGKLIEAGKVTVNGQVTHEFGPAITFWFCAATMAVLLACTLWRVKARD